MAYSNDICGHMLALAKNTTARFSPHKVKSDGSQESIPQEIPATPAPKCSHDAPDKYIPLNTKDLQEAETKIIRSVQREEFQKEISLLRTSRNQDDAQDSASFRVIKKKSSLYKLDPFLDHQGVLRVGGRL